ncbi:MAG: D-glycero-beta-D-manno-heptose 1-phosphate adenylyltransferase [Candidatus Lambdaproteobacteria bacterium]|nr:D-glycero-beta-D-manno-heptose 1-phosphate adenylyltransferase [Candidatus Lambdaproteobacteria bacterium]
MVDRYLWGEVERISPEAPVPVVRSVRDEVRLGGAANVAHNLAALGCPVRVCGIVGQDAAGREVAALLGALGVPPEGLIADPSRPTTEKQRIMAQHQQMLRFDREGSHPLAPELAARVLAHLEHHQRDYAGIIVSDYGKGLITEELMARVVALGRRAGKPVIVDPKGMDYSKYRGATCLTPNEHEASVAARLPIRDERDALRAGDSLLRELGLASLCITRGARGVLALAGGEHRFLAARAREVYDVTGAGDTFISVCGGLLTAGVEFFESVQIANLAAGVVVGKLGTATVTVAEILSFAEGAHRFFTAREIGPIAESLRAQGKRIVFTNGCFDLLHVGHIQYLQASRAMGDVLIVGLNSDDSVRRLKGPDRPVIGEADRANVLAALAAVDYVALFEEDTPVELIRAVKPHILTKGADYTVDTVVGHELVQEWGGEVRLVPLVENRSTSGLIEKIAKANKG